MNPVETDAESLGRIAKGDRAALGDLASRYEAGLLGMASGLLNGRHELAADAVQDCWLRVLRSADRFEGRSGVKAWLYRILINRCHDLRERWAPARPSPASEFAMRNGAAGGAEPGLEAEDGERLDGLRRAVGALSAEHRALVLLCYHAGMTHEQAADVLGIPVGTIKSRLHAALAALRERLGSARDGGAP